MAQCLEADVLQALAGKEVIMLARVRPYIIG